MSNITTINIEIENNGGTAYKLNPSSYNLGYIGNHNAYQIKFWNIPESEVGNDMYIIIDDVYSNLTIKRDLIADTNEPYLISSDISTYIDIDGQIRMRKEVWIGIEFVSSDNNYSRNGTVQPLVPFKFEKGLGITQAIQSPVQNSTDITIRNLAFTEVDQIGEDVTFKNMYGTEVGSINVGTSGTLNHSSLNQLDYAHSGHTGFASQEDMETVQNAVIDLDMSISALNTDVNSIQTSLNNTNDNLFDLSLVVGEKVDKENGKGLSTHDLTNDLLTEINNATSINLTQDDRIEALEERPIVHTKFRGFLTTTAILDITDPIEEDYAYNIDTVTIWSYSVNPNNSDIVEWYDTLLSIPDQATPLSDAQPLVDNGVGSAGTASTASRGDHRHPTDNSKLDVTLFNAFNAQYISEQQAQDDVINTKLDRVSTTTGLPQVYGKAINGAQIMSDVTSQATASTVMARSTTGTAQVATPVNGLDATNKSYVDNQYNSLATVATTGSYNDLTNKPTIPNAQVNSDWDAVSGVEEILNKPTIYSFTGTSTQYTKGDGTYAILDKTAVGLSNVDNTSDLSKPISTATQTALNGKVENVLYSINRTFTAINIPVNTQYNLTQLIRVADIVRQKTPSGSNFTIENEGNATTSLLKFPNVNREGNYQVTVTLFGTIGGTGGTAREYVIELRRASDNSFVRSTRGAKVGADNNISGYSIPIHTYTFDNTDPYIVGGLRMILNNPSTANDGATISLTGINLLITGTI